MRLPELEADLGLVDPLHVRSRQVGDEVVCVSLEIVQTNITNTENVIKKDDHNKLILKI
jgi:hypothetical protein